MSMASVDQIKVVARYSDGRVLKGTTTNFSTERQSFALQRTEAEGSLETVRLADLKALFFVRDFDGDPRRQDRQDFDNQPLGRAALIGSRRHISGVHQHARIHERHWAKQRHGCVVDRRIKRARHR